MSNKETGGPAFPTIEQRFPDGVLNNKAHDGMTLRDYFAAKAMQGYVSAQGYNGDSDHNLSFNAYALADAMLEARKVNHE